MIIGGGSSAAAPAARDELLTAVAGPIDELKESLLGLQRLAARGMPNVEVTGLTIVAKERKLFAASHGLSAWPLKLRGSRRR